jgi:hypothetical protein
MGGCGVSAIEYSCAHHVTWSPNKLFVYLPLYLTYVANLGKDGGALSLEELLLEVLDLPLAAGHPVQTHLVQAAALDLSGEQRFSRIFGSNLT